MLTVIVPDGVKGGQQMAVTTDVGPVTVVVPEGLGPGQTFQIAAPQVNMLPTTQFPIFSCFRLTGFAGL